jgi:hypothetical protein
LNGKKHGQGTYVWKDKSKYIGEWEGNKISGTVKKKTPLI